MSPGYVRPYVKAKKNNEARRGGDRRVCDPPTIRFAHLDSESHLQMQILHRASTRLVINRTALINKLRALPLERGIVVAHAR